MKIEKTLKKIFYKRELFSWPLAEHLFFMEGIQLVELQYNALAMEAILLLINSVGQTLGYNLNISDEQAGAGGLKHI